MLIQSSEFVISNNDYFKCPKPEFPEFAFIGRSNVGKSSLINMLCGRSNLAKISTSPGKTRLINHFIINNSWYLVDLPGYGYAKASKVSRMQWEKMVNSYLLNRENLMLTFILIDIRLDPQDKDIEMINWFGTNNLPISLIFTKRDKINQNTATLNITKFEQIMLKYWHQLPQVFITSSKTSIGRKEILNYITECFKLFKMP
jgi:GTP-binding protein